MVFFLGVVAPPPKVVVPEGYELLQDERRYVSERLVNKPVTVQHSQIRSHVESLDSLNLPLTSLNLRHKVPHIGKVLSCFQHEGWLWAIFNVDDHCELVLSLMHGGHLLCLSLTHTGTESGIMPIELTLCSVPARPFSYIYHECLTLEDAFNYKAHILAGSIPYKMDVTTASASTAPVAQADPASAPAVSRLSALLAKLEPAERSLIEARFTEIASAAEDAKLKQKATQEKLDKLIEIKDTDKKMFAEHFDYLLSQMPEEIQAKYAVNSSTREVLTESPPEVLHHVNQLIRCASASMVSAPAAPSSQPPLKRARSDPVVEQANEQVSEASPVAPSSTLLGRALADTFCL